MDDFNEARSVLYGALSLLFMYKAAGKKPQDTIKLLGAIEDSDFDGAATASAKTLQKALEQTDGFDKLEEEFDTLFMLPFGDAVPMSASVYYDDLEAGKPLLAVKEVLNLAALRRDDDNFGDNEDNFGFVFALFLWQARRKTPLQK
ncbi:hypothetical protein AGMMS50229_21460 [Campylobacterota bacterium]|nr:hypothetical protein AGMMS50229_21460 [Campylobacterota bacterium]